MLKRAPKAGDIAACSTAVNAPVHNPTDNPDNVRAIHKPGKLVVNVKVTLEAS